MNKPNSIGACVASCLILILLSYSYLITKEETNQAADNQVVKVHNVDQFNNLLKNNKQVVTKFYADWCGFCKTIKEPFEKMAAKNPKIVFAEIEYTADHGKQLAEEYNIQGFPTFTIHTNGKKSDVVVGANKPALEKKIQALAS